ncbi:MAG: hypothetical protein HYR58_03840 [Acidobacteria bacterium]|nr:hypothetical protein [Acidobacteriota bacterium]
MKKVLLIFGCLLLLPAGVPAGENLVYSVSYGEAGKFPPRLVKTEIFAVDVNAGKPRLVFSDASADFLLLPVYRAGGEPEQVMVTGGGKIFARGVERSRYPGGWYEFPASIYELPADGSGRARKVFDIQGEQSLRKLFVTPTGTKIGYINYLGQTQFIFIHDAATGTMLRKIDLSKIALDCFARNIGWLPDGARLFFTLETGDEHVTSRASYARVGSYVMKDDGTQPVRVPRELSAPTKRAGYSSAPDLPPVLLGALPDGRQLYKEFQWEQQGKGRRPVTFLYTVDPASKARKDYSTRAREGLFWFRVSNSGRAVAFTELLGQSDTEHVWVLDLQSGEERKIFSFATKSLTLPCLGIIGWMEER